MAFLTDTLAVRDRRRISQDFLRRWVACSVGGAVIVTVIDAALLQRREGYFTGGFLSSDHLSGFPEVVLFLALSLLVDAAVIGVLAGIVMYLCHRLRPRACAAAGVLAGLMPLVATDVVSYELVRYVGDTVDVQLMFDLANGSIAEMLAVSSAHLGSAVVLASAAVTGCGGLVWIVHRREQGDPAGRPPSRVFAVPLLVLGAALGAATTAVAANDRLANGVLRKPAGKALAVIGDEITDIDRDGFGVANRMSDPDARNARVFPYAVDLPGNGIDEDGIAGDLPGSVEPYVEAPPAGRWARRPDVVLIVLESFRFDLLGTRFDGRPVTPALDALAARGVSSQRAYSHNGYTAQSRFHMLAGSLAGIRDRATLIDDFKANGYATVYVSGQDESFGGPRYDIGFSRADIAFDARSDRDRRYSTFTTAGSLAVPFSVVQERVTESLERRVAPDRPLFLYANFHDTHFPYSHERVETLTSAARLPRHRIVPGERAALWATYVNTAANVDRAVSYIVGEVRRLRGVEPAVIVTADHGESLFDNDFLGHGHALDEVQTRVPLIVANLPMVIEEPFGHVDLRDAMWRALQTPHDAPPVPQLRQSPDRRVFQYLGTINRPRQIGVRDRNRLTYDFRTARVQIDDGAWMRPAELAPGHRADFARLVRDWERMMLARSASEAE